MSAKEPVNLQLDAGNYYLCTCGQSKNFPYCDGTHQGTTYRPIALTLKAPQAVTFKPEMNSVTIG
ncbi:MAG: CDGSH iron-sulfur domain-containing protein [Leptolyngbyaceae cyanobacterium bins.59]|nr:CDGSH iron-sulfur domain-containing protein [Leptolyngbyaceae cyanobacterium bins.59]